MMNHGLIFFFFWKVEQLILLLNENLDNTFFHIHLAKIKCHNGEVCLHCKRQQNNIFVNTEVVIRGQLQCRQFVPESLGSFI